MSFLRRLALKSVMAAKKDSTVWSGTTRWGKHEIKTIQYLAEADPSRVLVALDLKAAFQNVSRRAMLYSIEQNDPDLAAVFPKGTQEPQSTGCTTILPAPRSVPTMVLIRDALSRLRFFRRPLIPCYGPGCQTLLTA